MIKTIFLIFIGIIGVPLYALCVAFLYIVGAVLGLSYVDMSVYVCEYVQPILTAVFALMFSMFATRKIVKSAGRKMWLKAASLSAILLTYIVVIGYCVREFIDRSSAYVGMTNRQIFDFVVNKLRVMGEAYPKGAIKLFTGETIGYGYIMANIEVYLMPISIVLILGIIQWRLSRKTMPLRDSDIADAVE